METPAQLLPHVDELIMEYLLFRGFTKSFQALNAERKRDRAKAFDVEQIITQLLAFVQSYQLESILDTWKFLEARFFSRLDASYAATIRQLEDSWLRLYVVNAIKNGHRDKAIELFKLLADKMNASTPMTDASATDFSWHRWFIVPYVQHPESDPYFQIFFTKEWLESFVTSFRNFLSLIFRNLPLPKLLAFQISRLEEPSLTLRLKASQSECSRLRLHNSQTSGRIRKLEDAGRHLYGMVQTMVEHTFADQFSRGPGIATATATATATGTTPHILSVMTALSAQLSALQSVFHPAMPPPTTAANAEMDAALLGPLQVKLPSTLSDSDHDEASLPGGSISPAPSSASSALSTTSLSSPVRNSSKFPISGPFSEPIVVCDTVFTSGIEQANPAAAAFCLFSYSGQRLCVSRVGQQEIVVLDATAADADGRLQFTVRDRIQTGSCVVSVAWISQSTQQLIYALQDRAIIVWDTEINQCISTFPSDATTSDDGWRPLHIACASEKAIGAVVLERSEGEASSSRVQFFTIKDQELRVLSSIDLDLDTKDSVTSITWASDGSILALEDSTGSASLISSSTTPPSVIWTSKLAGGSTIATHDDRLLACGNQHQIFQWSTTQLINSDGAPLGPPQYVYNMGQPEGNLEQASSSRSVKIFASKSNVLVAMDGINSSNETSILLFERDRVDPIGPPIQIASRVDAMAWRFSQHQMIAALTKENKLLAWRLQPT